VLTAEAIEIIETNAETVLAEIGVNFVDNPAALERWRNAGADVQGERVRIPRGLAGNSARPHPRASPNTPATPSGTW
jgi:trimethylamine---corrinoid protein Co-methyltransferase